MLKVIFLFLCTCTLPLITVYFENLKKSVHMISKNSNYFTNNLPWMLLTSQRNSLSLKTSVSKNFVLYACNISAFDTESSKTLIRSLNDILANTNQMGVQCFIPAASSVGYCIHSCLNFSHHLVLHNRIKNI